MEKSADTISRRKFQTLTHRQCHKILADLARRALAGSDVDSFGAFVSRYEEMTSWVSVDRYFAPLWLTPREAMEETFHFHQQFSHRVVERLEPKKPHISRQAQVPIDVVLDQVRSPYQVGSILRIMDNFGFQSLIHATQTLSRNHPQLRKSARGCQTWIPMHYRPALFEELQQSKRPVIALEQSADAVPLSRWRPPGPCLVVLGNETYGISRAFRSACQETVSIPVSGFKHSMSVSHAFAIFAHHVTTRWQPSSH